MKVSSMRKNKCAFLFDSNRFTISSYGIGQELCFFDFTILFARAVEFNLKNSRTLMPFGEISYTNEIACSFFTNMSAFFTRSFVQSPSIFLLIFVIASISTAVCGPASFSARNTATQAASFGVFNFSASLF